MATEAVAGSSRNHFPFSSLPLWPLQVAGRGVELGPREITMGLQDIDLAFQWKVTAATNLPA